MLIIKKHSETHLNVHFLNEIFRSIFTYIFSNFLILPFSLGHRIIVSSFRSFFLSFFQDKFIMQDFGVNSISSVYCNEVIQIINIMLSEMF